MKVAMIGHKRVPSHEGGIEVVVEELATRMVQQGHSVTCYNRSGHHVSGKEHTAERRSEYKGIRIKYVPTIDVKGLAAVTSSFFACLAAALGDYDAVHIHAEGPAFFCWIPHLFHKRVVVTVHGLDWARGKWKGGMGAHYILQGEKMAVRFADAIIVLNHSTQEYFQETYGRKTHYIPNGVNVAEKRDPELIEKRYGLEKDSYILYLGRIVPEKRCDLLCDAYEMLHTDKKLVIAGGASDSDSYMEELKARFRSNENILFTGFVDGQLREELYSNAYLFVLPSDLEGMSLCLLEAMSYGNCVLCTDIEESTNVVGEHGLRFQKDDRQSLAEKMQYALEHRNVVKIFKYMAPEYVCSRFPWDKVVAKTLELYGVPEMEPMVNAGLPETYTSV